MRSFANVIPEKDGLSHHVSEQPSLPDTKIGQQILLMPFPPEMMTMKSHKWQVNQNRKRRIIFSLNTRKS
jgi:hypothetical protein